MSDTHNLSFGDALELMEGGKRVARSGWLERGFFIRFDDEKIEALGEMVDHIVINDGSADNDGQGNDVSWGCPQQDVIAKDWGEVVAP